MNENYTGDNSPTTDNEPVDINQLVSRVEELEQRVGEQQSTIEDQQSTIESQQDEIEKLKEDRNTAGKVRADIKSEIHTLQESLEGDSDGIAPTPTPNDGQTSIQKHELTPVEQVSRVENVDDVTDSPSVKRAISLFKNIAEWGNRTPKGIVLNSSDNPLSLLSADMDESLCWKQYYRAAEALESLSEGAVTFINSDRHGKMLILHEHSEVSDRMMNGTLSMSSESTTV